MKWLKRLFCTHTFTHVRNIHGDEIILRGFRRSLWECTQCEAFRFRNKLVPTGPLLTVHDYVGLSLEYAEQHKPATVWIEPIARKRAPKNPLPNVVYVTVDKNGFITFAHLA